MKYETKIDLKCGAVVLFSFTIPIFFMMYLNYIGIDFEWYVAWAIFGSFMIPAFIWLVVSTGKDEKELSKQ